MRMLVLIALLPFAACDKPTTAPPAASEEKRTFYVYKDGKGVENVVDDYQSVPEKYRATARAIGLAPPPPAPAKKADSLIPALPFFNKPTDTRAATAAAAPSAPAADGVPGGGAKRNTADTTASPSATAKPNDTPSNTQNEYLQRAKEAATKLEARQKANDAAIEEIERNKH